MKVFAVLLLAVCAASAAVVDSVVKVERKGGNFAYSIDGLVPHTYMAPTSYVAPSPYMAHTPYVAPVPVHPGVGPVVGKPVMTYTANHPVGAYPVPVGGYYGYGAPIAAYPYGVPYGVRPEKFE